ncbi:MAG TPA: ABC transporter permease, partial [Verrucomicrobiae bacterium]|nr:ABC transporter permease [Verrucomicrobiae bacterium]
KFGNTLRVRENIHQAWGWTWIDNLGQDLRYAFRLLRKAPGFTFVVVITLALGIGANTAIFSVVNAVLLQALPYTRADQLVSIFESNLREGVKATGCSYQDFKQLRDSGVFADVAGVQRHDLTLTEAGDPTVVSTVVVTPEVFSLLNVAPLTGRYLFPDDDKTGAAPVVVLSEGLWRNRFGADPTLVGRSIHLDQQGYTVVGIMPAGFGVPVFGSHQEIWIPLAQDPLFGSWMPRPGGHWLRVMGRLKPGTTLASVQPQTNAVAQQLATEFPQQNSGWNMKLAPLQAVIVGEIKTPLLVLLGAVGLVLLLACVNIANLLLARSTFRTREVALRQAFGASQIRIVRQFLTESAVLGVIGAVLGVVIAYLSLHALGSLLPSDAPAARPVHLDASVLGFSLLLSFIASLGFGLAPALFTARTDVQANLKQGSLQSGSDRGRLRLRNFLTGAEIALAMVIVVAAGLLVRSLIRMTEVDPGFQPEHLLKAEVSLPRYQYKTPQQWAAFSDALLERIQVQPGMENTAVAVPLPIANGFVNLAFVLPDHAPLPPGESDSADYVSVTPKYFGVMGIPLLRGRLFTTDDSISSPRVALISESFARRYFANESPVGKMIKFGFPPDADITREIVGVVGNVRDVGLAQEPGAMMYVPFAQAPFWGGVLVVKSTLPTPAVAGAIRQAVAAIDKNLPVTDIETMPGVLQQSVAQPRFRTWLLSAFGLVALLLAAAGVYGVVSYSVASRTREFGVRASLGASPGSIAKLVLREGITLAAAGLIVGLCAALALARFLRSELYGVGAYDPVTFVASIAVLLAVALAACYIPARRAMRVDPMVALRYE